MLTISGLVLFFPEYQECDFCLAVAPILDSILKTDKLKDYTYVFASVLCILDAIMSPRVCVMGVQEWGPTGLAMGRGCTEENGLRGKKNKKKTDFYGLMSQRSINHLLHSLILRIL